MSTISITCAWCTGRDSNSHRAFAPPGPEPGVSTKFHHPCVWSARGDSNSHEACPTRPSTWRVYHSATRGYVQRFWVTAKAGAARIGAGLRGTALLAMSDS